MSGRLVTGHSVALARYVIYLLSGLIILTLLHACHTQKSVLRNRQSASVNHHFTGQMSSALTARQSRVSVVNDSTLQFSRVTIFPADTFRFSLAHGFVGKAIRVEMDGVLQQRKQGVEVVGTETNVRDERSMESSVEVERSENVVEKDMERSGGKWVWGIGVLLGVVWMVWWVRKRWLFVGGG